MVHTYVWEGWKTTETLRCSIRKYHYFLKEMKKYQIWADQICSNIYIYKTLN